MSNKNCPVCEGALTAQPESRNLDYWLFRCPRCGDFKMHRTLQQHLEVNLAQLGLQSGDRAKFSAWIRTRTERTDEVIRNLDILQDIRDRNNSAEDKQELLLRHLKDRADHLGQPVRIDLDTDFPVVWAHSRDELVFHLKEVLRFRFIEMHERTPRHWIVSMTTSGLASLEGRPPLTDVGFHTV